MGKGKGAFKKGKEEAVGIAVNGREEKSWGGAMKVPCRVNYKVARVRNSWSDRQKRNVRHCHEVKKKEGGFGRWKMAKKESLFSKGHGDLRTGNRGEKDL